LPVTIEAIVDSPILGVLLPLGVLWIGRFLWFPGGESLLSLLVRDGQPPATPEEIWAMDLYRATFSPDYGAPWVPTSMVVVAWLSWFVLLGLTLVATLAVGGLLPKESTTASILVTALGIWVLASVALSVISGLEMTFLWKRGIPLRNKHRKTDWIGHHPAPPCSWPTGTLPWWFWLDSRGFETIRHVALFLGGFLATILTAFYMVHVSNPMGIGITGFWNLVTLWTITTLWAVIPITVGLSHLDWSRRDRKLLLFWAAKQR